MRSIFTRVNGGRAPMTMAAAAAAVLVSATAVAQGEQILQLWQDSLTAYLPGAASSGQDVWPLHSQRGVNIDGSSRTWSALGWSLAGNPLNVSGAESWNSNIRFGDLRVDLGAYSPTEVDLSLPSNGFRWIVGRTYNGVQVDAMAAHRDSDGPQGKNWFQISQPEIVFVNGASDDKDAVYIVYGADRYIEFQRADSTATEYKAKNGAAGVVQYASGSPDTWTYTDQHGNKTVFFGGNTSSGRADWQLWKMTDPAGNVCYVGDATTASTAASSGYNADQTIALAYDGSTQAGGGGRRYTYTYTTIDGVSRLTQVKAETKASGSWSSPSGLVEVGKVEYGYYTGNSTDGNNGNLKLVTITTPLTDSGVSMVKKKLYRYYVGNYDASTNPGNANSIKLVVGFEGYRSYDWDQDSTLDDDTQSASLANLKSYADAYFEYSSGDYRIAKAFFNGECGCSGGNNGSYEFTYGQSTSYATMLASGTYNATDPDGGGSEPTQADLATRTVIKRPDTTYQTRYFDETGQPLNTIVTDTAPSGGFTKMWGTRVLRNASGQIIELRTPANISAYTHDSGGNFSGAMTSEAATGLIHQYTRVSGGDRDGFVEYKKHKNAGTGGLSYYDQKTTYIASGSAPKMTVGSVDINRPVISDSEVYEAESNAVTTSQQTVTAVAAHASAGSLMIKSSAASAPAVSSSQNGSGSATTATRYLRADGTGAFSVTATGRYTYSQYTNGLLVKRIDDAQTNHGSDFASGDDPNGDFGVTESADGIRNVTTYAYDAQGRMDTSTLPDGRVTKMYYSKLADGRMVTISCPLVSGGNYYGPMSYTVTNHAGKAEVQATVGISSSGIATALTGWIDESDADPITALDIGSLVRLTVTVLNDSGTRENEIRAYHLIPGSGAGSSGTNYDATVLGYDDMGRKWRVKQPSGTITRSVYDTLGRTIESWIGTNDYSFTGGESSGPDTMTKTSTTEYDGSAGSQKGNSYVTKRTLDADGDWGTAGDQRVTTYTNDARGRAILVTSPLAPHTLSKYDNLNRIVAVGQYNAVTGLSVTSDPTSVATADSGNTDRLELNETLYDERGQVWKTIRHKIDDADGSDDDTLVSFNWYDPDGRQIKSKSPGGLSKTRYDRLGRITHRWTLATDNDAANTYADVYASGTTQVGGDIVLEESQTTYEDTSGNVLMQATISRAHDDLSNGNTGALDTNADNDVLMYTAANIKGRIQITASWYDDLDRVTTTASYGTNGSGNASDFDRDGLSAPSPSDTVLVTTYSYDTDGGVQDVTDPRGKVTRSVRDHLGRTTATISNYVNGTPSGANGDDDNYVRNVYSNGLQTKMWVDLDGDNAEDADDQVTVYTYGTAKGASAGDSNIATGHLLQKTTYPDSSSGTDVVTFAYNAQSQQMWTKDQAGGVIETTFDTLGRTTYRRVTTLASGFDGSVRRIGTTYTSRGQVELVTQYDNATVGAGSVVDEVKYTYDDWGNVTTFEQDRDGAVGGGGNQYTVGYTWAKATPSGGHDTLRCTGMTLPGTGDTATITYTYDSASNALDDAVSRVSKLQTGGGPTTRATYKYLGTAHLVGTDVIEPDVYSRRYGSGTANYDAVDRFNRTTVSRWTKYISPAKNFYDVTLAYDRASNITSTDDAVLAGFDAAYTMDNRNRLTRADEGTLSSGSITSRTRDQQWTLSQPGNWIRNKLDLNGNGSFADGGELDDTGTFNTVNELTARDIDTSGGNDYTLTYDAVGNLTNDGEDYKYVYDAFGRLVTVKNRSNDAVVAEYTYYGVNYRKSWHYDADTDGDVDANDKTYRFAYDTSWRMVATFRDGDSNPKERFVWNNAGLNGRGGSSYIDSAVLRDRDMTNGWTGSADGTLEQRHYYCQNWRADVSVVLKYEDSVWRVAEWIKYSAYGVPFSITPADFDNSGFVDIDDDTDFDTAYNGGAGSWSARVDLDLDGSLTSADEDIFDAEFIGGEQGGRHVLSRDSVANRLGYAGYQYDPTFVGAERSFYHVRHRVYDASTGRWTRRDPIESVPGASLYAYPFYRSPLMDRDPSGLGCPGEKPGYSCCENIACYNWEISACDATRDADYYAIDLAWKACMSAVASLYNTCVGSCGPTCSGPPSCRSWGCTARCAACAIAESAGKTNCNVAAAAAKAGVDIWHATCTAGGHSKCQAQWPTRTCPPGEKCISGDCSHYKGGSPPSGGGASDHGGAACTLSPNGCGSDSTYGRSSDQHVDDADSNQPGVCEQETTA